MHSRALFKITVLLAAAFVGALMVLIVTGSSHAFEPEPQTVWPPRNAVAAALNTTIGGTTTTTATSIYPLPTWSTRNKLFRNDGWRGVRRRRRGARWATPRDGGQDAWRGGTTTTTGTSTSTSEEASTARQQAVPKRRGGARLSMPGHPARGHGVRPRRGVGGLRQRRRPRPLPHRKVVPAFGEQAVRNDGGHVFDATRTVPSGMSD